MSVEGSSISPSRMLPPISRARLQAVPLQVAAVAAETAAQVEAEQTPRATEAAEVERAAQELAAAVISDLAKGAILEREQIMIPL